MFTDPIRHEAMARARDSGMPAATAKVTLVQETQQGTQVGFLIYVPVYARGAPTRTVEERRRALVGFIYSPFRAQDLFEGIFAHKTADNPIDFEVFTEARAERQALLYERVQGDYPPSSVWDRTNLVQPYSLNVGGQKWTVVTRPLPLFYDKSSRVVPRAIALFGLLGSILLFWIVRRHGRYIEAERERAFQMETLNRIGKVLSAELDLKKLVQAVTDAGKELSKAQFGTFYYHVTDQKGESSTLYSLSGLSREQLGRQHVQSMLEVPVVSRTGEEIGRLIYSHMRPNVFGEREKKLVEGLAAQSAIAVDNARLFQRSKDAISLRDEFLSIASHELKTPITSLKLHLQMTRRAVKPEQGITPPAEKLARVLDTSTTQVNRLSALIDDLLDVSRIQAGKLTYHFEKTELAGLVREMVDRFCEQLQAAGCETSIQTDEPVYVRCDRFRLEQVILNLLSNATKYGAGRPIEVIVENQSGMARVVVRDRGMGIPSEKLEMVFERFERAVSPSNISGLGLGLYISREIVNAHHGHIHVESQLGQGSSFIVDLPIAADQSSTQPSSMGQAG
jgi:signal transduction histidine kinase